MTLTIIGLTALLAIVLTLATYYPSLEGCECPECVPYVDDGSMELESTLLDGEEEEGARK